MSEPTVPPTETTTELDKDQLIMSLTKKNCLLESKLANLESSFEKAQETVVKANNQVLSRELELIDMSKLAYPMAIDTNSKKFKVVLTEKLSCFFPCSVSV